MELPESARGPEGFGVHPALLDAALHPLALEAGEGTRLPFAWSGVSLLGGGGGGLRVRISAGDGDASLALFDAIGTPIGRVGSLLARPLDPEQLQARAEAPLYELAWQRPTPSPTPSVPTDTWRAPRGEGAGATHAATLATLRKLQDRLAGEPADSRLAILAEGALTARDGESPDPAAAALAGLIRSAAAEHPGRFCLIDSDGSEASEAAIERALGLDPREPLIALREGELLVPRLERAKEETGEAIELDPERTVLITGGTGGLGALVASHLAEAHGARHLLLISRSGEWAREGMDLRSRLAELGVDIRLAACDVSDRGRLEALLDAIPAEHSLGAVIHCAAVLDDGLLESLDEERLDRVFAAKADGARHLHELTADLDLTHFVCFSSVAGLLGSPGQANYAAANAFLDGLAAHRRARGLPANSIAWGLWVEESGMVGQLGAADLARMRRAGIAALSEQQGLALLDRVLATGPAVSAAVRFDRAALRAQAAAGGLAAVLERLAGSRGRVSAASPGGLHRRLREAPEAARAHFAEDFVRAEVAAILGHDSAAAVAPDDVFKDLGFDSLAAIELRNRLGAASGRRLAASVVFDYPTAAALAGHLLEQMGEAGDAEPGPAPRSTAPSRLTTQLEEASDEELLEYIDAQVGSDLG